MFKGKCDLRTDWALDVNYQSFSSMVGFDTTDETGKEVFGGEFSPC